MALLFVLFHLLPLLEVRPGSMGRMLIGTREQGSSDPEHSRACQ